MLKSTLTRLSLGLGLVFGTLSAAWAAAPTYRIVDLGLHGNRYAHAWAMNERGEVMGEVGGHRSRPFIWSPEGGMRFLGTTLYATSYQFHAMNNLGQVVGERRTKGFLWHEENGLLEIEGLGSDWNAAALGINDSGMVTGYSNPYLHWNKPHAIAWTGLGGTVDLNPPDARQSKGFDINNHGQIAGYMEAKGLGHVATIFQQGQAPRVLGCLKPGLSGRCHREGEAHYINDAGQVAGTDAKDQTHIRAFFWTEAGGMRDMAKGRYSDQAVYPLGMNLRGQVVGERYNHEVDQTAFYWDEENGMVDIQSLLDPNDPLNTGEFRMYQPVGIDGEGRIGINAIVDGIYHAWVLEPVR